ncbi:MAG: ferredoxin [Pseudomonadota bacterium]
MDMAAKFQDQLVFHMTGKLAGDGLSPVDDKDLRPALLARYRDLTPLRYDYPVVLVEGDGNDYALSLSALVNRTLAEVAPRGIEGERLRRHGLRLERELRALLAHGAAGRVSELWKSAAARIATDADDAAADVLARAGDALNVDGALVDCDAALPARFVAHAWRHVQRGKARQFRALVDQLLRKLTDIRRAAFVNSEAGRRPEALRAAVGAGHADVFDFVAMSRLVARRAPKDELPAARRARIEWALSVLRAQPFYPDPGAASHGAPPLAFEFDSCAAAIEAYRARLPKIVELVKALAIAELEAAGAYVEADHDPFFDRYDENALTADDLALFPDYLVCIPPGRNDAPENASLMQMLSSGLPVKVLVQADDLIDEASIGTGHFTFGVRSSRLATTAMGLGGMFVLQSPSSNLYALRERVRRGLACRGPALFAVYGGTPKASSTLPPYLAAAAAMESRAFPAFTYDAAAGGNWAARFSLENNRDPDADWTVESLEFADDALQRVRERVAFTYADFALCDRRHSAHFAVVPRDRWNAAMLPVSDWLARPEGETIDRVPYLWAVDADDRLHRVIVDARLMQAARRALLLWHRLQEHGGIHNSHAEQLLTRERAAWEAQKRQELDSLQQAGAAAAAVAPAAAEGAAPAAAPPAIEAAVEKPPSDDAWIETARCPSCGECRNINDRMFGYNENKQAYIKDIDAGTYRQLVEAAESCQVAIIHPGKPRNPNEPGLAELLERAKPFL